MIIISDKLWIKKKKWYKKKIIIKINEIKRLYKNKYIKYIICIIIYFAHNINTPTFFY